MVSIMPNENEKVIKLSVVIPCYNEAKTIGECIEKVLNISSEYLHIEVVLIDDCSTDGSHAIAQKYEKKDKRVTVSRHDKNQGKGAALQTGFKKATGDFIAIQDADLEYNPEDMLRLLVPLMNNKADVVYGSSVFASWTSQSAVFLAFCGKSFAHNSFKHAHKFKFDGHGGLLQNIS